MPRSAATTAFQQFPPRTLAPRRAAVAALLAAIALGSTGCTVCRHARRTLLQEPAEYSWKFDQGRSLKAYRQWADQAWAMESGSCPEVAGVEEYALGFRDGFVDYVYAGGPGEPPPVPPRKFWNVAWRTPQGTAAAQQWFAGYRHGAATARSGGYRNNGIVQSSYFSAPGHLAGPIPWDSVHGIPAESEALGTPAEILPGPPAATEYGDELPAPPTPPEGDPTAELPAVDPAVDPAVNPAGEPAGEAPTTLPPLEPAPPESTPPQPGPLNEFPDLPMDEPEPADPSAATSATQRFRRAVTNVQFPEAGPQP